MDAARLEFVSHLDRGQRLAAQADQEHRGHVGMIGKALQRAPRLRQVIPELAATVDVRDRNHVGQRLADAPDCAVRALDRGHHQDAVAHAHPPVAAPVAHERGDGQLALEGGLGLDRGIALHQGHEVRGQVAAAAQALDVVHVDMLARRDIRDGAADGLAVLDDEVARGDNAPRDLMAGRDGRGKRQRQPFHMDDMPGCQGRDCLQHVIVGVHQEDIHESVTSRWDTQTVPEVAHVAGVEALAGYSRLCAYTLKPAEASTPILACRSIWHSGHIIA